ncbi:MAG: hypothetical protein LBS16_07290 [Prevotellaceae bacterium]|jgi:hypothetical protein|nr:hypothetical protein [Prevotellaceae bacterium]
MHITEWILLGIFCCLINVPLGYWRECFRKFSTMWFVLVHASVPLIVALRIWLDVPSWLIPVNIALAVLGQYLGGQCRKRKKKLLSTHS